MFCLKLFFATAVALSATALAAPAEVRRSIVDQSSQIRFEGSEEPLCLDVTGGKTEPGTQVIIYTCWKNVASNQLWQFRSDLKELRSPLSIYGELCLDASGSSLTLEKCNEKPTQEFYIYGRNIISQGKCVGVPEGKTSSGQAAQLLDCQDGAKNQFFTYYGAADMHWKEVAPEPTLGSR